ncbi:MAG TPA: hypothetical protein VFU78_04535 [Thermomicrobiales bacterium]|nr:hypothetical protein [Thermomicrobiales bacterium]
MTLKETLGHADIKTTSIYRSMSEQQLIAQQRKVNPIGQVGKCGRKRRCHAATDGARAGHRLSMMTTPYGIRMRFVCH